jgi:Zn-dependent peptidase ImmA (M78 family)
VIPYNIPEVLRHVRSLTLPASPPPSQFLRHTEVIDPLAEAYADLYHTCHGFPVQAEALERFLELDLGLPYGWEEIVEPEGVRILAQHDPLSGAVQANALYAELFAESLALLVSSLLHELGHIALRHGEIYAEDTLPFLPGLKAPGAFLHRTTWLPWGVSAEVLKRAVKVANLDQRVHDFLKPQHFEPDWVYQQAQRFAAAFMIPTRRLREHLAEGWDFTRWWSVYELAGRFATSSSMMRYRLEQLGYISVQGKVISPGPHYGKQIPLL